MATAEATTKTAPRVKIHLQVWTDLDGIVWARRSTTAVPVPLTDTQATDLLMIVDRALRLCAGAKGMQS